MYQQQSQGYQPVQSQAGVAGGNQAVRFRPKGTQPSGPIAGWNAGGTSEGGIAPQASGGSLDPWKGTNTGGGRRTVGLGGYGDNGAPNAGGTGYPGSYVPPGQPPPGGGGYQGGYGGGFVAGGGQGGGGMGGMAGGGMGAGQPPPWSGYGSGFTGGGSTGMSAGAPPPSNSGGSWGGSYGQSQVTPQPFNINNMMQGMGIPRSGGQSYTQTTRMPTQRNVSVNQQQYSY